MTDREQALAALDAIALIVFDYGKHGSAELVLLRAYLAREAPPTPLSDAKAIDRMAEWLAQHDGIEPPDLDPEEWEHYQAMARELAKLAAPSPGLGTPDAWLVVEFGKYVSAALRSAPADTERLDWLEEGGWFILEKTDESDNNGVGLVDSAVTLRSQHPDRATFVDQRTATVREAIDAARASSPDGAPNV